MTAWNGHERVTIDPETGMVTGDKSGKGAGAVAPVIVSASRSTDIPAFYGDWFLERLRRGYAAWTNPFNGHVRNVSFENARIFVFWSKNPRQFLPALRQMVEEGRQVLFLFTVNDYAAEGLEPGIPSLDERVRTFSTVSSVLGKGRVAWRFDPLVLTDTLTVDSLLERIAEIGDRIHGDTSRLLFSFVDIEGYPRVAKNLAAAGFAGIREPSPAEEDALARGIAALNESWGLEVRACGEGRDFREYGILPGACISADVLAREFPGDKALMDFLRPALSGKKFSDPGQRKSCGCVPSKDIGHYSTCPHLCRYCYANASPGRVRANRERYCNRPAGSYPPSLIG